jgi:hypothetical protein
MGADLKELSESNVLLEKYPAQQAAGEDLSTSLNKLWRHLGEKGRRRVQAPVEELKMS